MGARTSQTVVEPLVIPTPKARVTQIAVEGVSIPLRSGVNGRVTQVVVEAASIPLRSGTNARLTQTIVEFLYIPRPTRRHGYIMGPVYAYPAQAGGR